MIYAYKVMLLMDIAIYISSLEKAWSLWHLFFSGLYFLEQF